MPEPVSPERTRRLADPALHAKVRSVLPRNLQPADGDDVVQKVFIRLLLIAELPPTPERLMGLAIVVTKRVAVDHFRRVGVKKGREVDVEEHVDVLGASEPEVSIDEGEQLRLALQHVEERVAEGDLPANMLVIARMLAEGKSDEEIAAVTGQTKAAVKMAKSRLRKHLRQYWVAYLAGASLAIVLLVFAVRRPSGACDIGRDLTGETPAPATSTQPQLLYSADHYIGMAQDACDDQFWDDCEKNLDYAKQVDPLSEQRPQVVEMREKIAKVRAPSDAGEPFKGPIK
jgi:DNA-directed RNA polymerase specialized sigma24 family protein